MWFFHISQFLIPHRRLSIIMAQRKQHRTNDRCSSRKQYKRRVMFLRGELTGDEMNRNESNVSKSGRNDLTIITFYYS